jgi:hypothetical protein
VSGSCLQSGRQTRRIRSSTSSRHRDELEMGKAGATVRVSDCHRNSNRSIKGDLFAFKGCSDLLCLLGLLCGCPRGMQRTLVISVFLLRRFSSVVSDTAIMTRPLKATASGCSTGTAWTRSICCSTLCVPSCVSVVFACVFLILQMLCAFAKLLLRDSLACSLTSAVLLWWSVLEVLGLGLGARPVTAHGERRHECGCASFGGPGWWRV